MPDIGGFGRGLLKGALSATEKAAEKVKEAAEAASRKMTDDDDPDATQVVKSTEPDPDATQVIKVEDPDATQVVRTSPNPTTPAGAPAHAAPPAAVSRGNAQLAGMPPATAPPTTRPPAAGPSATPLSAAVPPAGAPPTTQPSAAVPPASLSAAAPSAEAPSAAPRSAAVPPVAVAPGSVASAIAPPVAASSGAAASAVPPAVAVPRAVPLSAAAPAGMARGHAPGAGASAVVPPVAVAPGSAASAIAVPAGPPSVAGEVADQSSGDDERADASDVRELVEMFQQMIAKRRPPAGPVPGEWSVGIGDLLADHPKVPKRVRGLVSKLNRFGGLAFSPEEVAFDGDDVPWEKVTEVRTRHIVDYLVGDAVQQQVESLPMPWFPGRQRLLDALGQALLTVTIATAKDQLDGLDLNFRIPAEVVYKGSFGRSKELNAGVISALVLADPAVSRSLVATAQARGVTVTASEDELLADADERAEQIRQKVKALEAELDRFTKRFKRTTDG